jgi:hypothetical protein
MLGIFSNSYGKTFASASPSRPWSKRPPLRERRLLSSPAGRPNGQTASRTSSVRTLERHGAERRKKTRRPRRFAPTASGCGGSCGVKIEAALHTLHRLQLRHSAQCQAAPLRQMQARAQPRAWLDDEPRLRPSAPAPAENVEATRRGRVCLLRPMLPPDRSRRALGPRARRQRQTPLLRTRAPRLQPCHGWP